MFVPCCVSSGSSIKRIQRNYRIHGIFQFIAGRIIIRATFFPGKNTKWKKMAELEMSVKMCWKARAKWPTHSVWPNSDTKWPKSRYPGNDRYASHQDPEKIKHFYYFTSLKTITMDDKYWQIRQLSNKYWSSLFDRSANKYTQCTPNPWKSRRKKKCLAKILKRGHRIKIVWFSKVFLFVVWHRKGNLFRSSKIWVDIQIWQ